MRALIPFRLCGLVAGALIAGLLSVAAPIATYAADNPAASVGNSADPAVVQPRSFASEPAAAANTGNPTADAGPQQRLALVIGNSNYQNVVKLDNPANDARAISQLLNSAGFEVIQATDLGHDEMIDVLRSFAAKIAEKGPNTVAFVYYAGHGVQIDGDNYLIPVDANITGEADVPNASIRLIDVMATLQSVPSRMRMVVVDACRNDPFASTGEASSVPAGTGEASRGLGGLGQANHGLAIVDAPNGSLVGYSTAPGAEALDGQGNDSPYANAFLKLARQPDVPIEQFFKNVRVEVNKDTDGQQTPWESSSLTSNFYFFGDTTQAATQQPVREFYSSASMQGRSPADAYRYALATDSVQGYQDFIAFYPQDPMCGYIRSLLAAKLVAVAWHQAVLANSPFAYQAFYNQYPVSPYAKDALKLEHAPKILPLYQPSNNFAPAKFSQQFKFTSLHQINPGHGEGNGLGGQQIHTLVPGADLAKQGNGLKTNPVINEGHVTALGENKGKLDHEITDNHATSLSNKDAPKVEHNDRLVEHENGEKFKAVEPNGGHVLNNSGMQFHPANNNGFNRPNLFKANNGPAFQPRPMLMPQRGFGGGMMHFR